MKTRFTLLSAAALLMVACGGEKTFTITGSAPLADDGTQVILMSPTTQEAIDTTEVMQGAFTFVMPATAEPEARIVTLGRQSAQAITDGSAVTVVFEENATKSSGTKLTEAWQKFVDDNTSFYTEVRAEMNKLAETYKDDPVKHREEYTKYYEEVVKPASDKMYKSAFEANPHTPVGAMLFVAYISADEESDLEQIDAYFTEYPAAKNYKEITRKRENLVNVAKTDVGQMFTDFTVKNIENTDAAKLSDYVGNGQYVLVDFWASWCGPCMNAIPNLKVMYDKYGGDNFTVLGVNVWDTHDKAIATLETKDLKWANIFDEGQRESVATTTYGVTGIPTLILFAPDGTIMLRTHDSEEMMALVEETMSK